MPGQKKYKRKGLLAFLMSFCVLSLFAQPKSGGLFCGHEVLLDSSSKVIPWAPPGKNAYDHFLRLRWNFVVSKAPASPGPAPRSLYPQYYFYCAFRDSGDQLLPDLWMNDVGEKIPMWFESARLFYAYSGDAGPLTIAKGMVDYSLEHGITGSGYSWPGFPQTAADAGVLKFRGFTSARRFSEDDVQVDHAGDLGATYFKMYLFYGDIKYKKSAIAVADVLVKKIRTGSATKSPWPYVVNTKSGKIVSDYGTNWFGCIRLLDMLISAGVGNVEAYTKVRQQARDWLLQYPVKNGIWVDGHTDTYITGTSNLSNLSASNAGLYISDFPAFDEGWKTTLPGLIQWTERNFVAKSAPGEPSSMWGANIVSEQVAFMPKMDYQTARYAAQCAEWYAISGDTAYREKAYRSLNWVTYCNDTTGKVFESPFSKGVNSWWSDSYGEGPSMIYHALAAVPEWAPVGENHILYSTGIVSHVSYSDKNVRYTAPQQEGIEYLRLSYKPASVVLNAEKLSEGQGAGKSGYVLKELGSGDFSLTIKRVSAGTVSITGLR